MSNVGEISFKIIYYSCLLVILFVGVFGLIHRKKNGTQKRKKLLLIIIAITLFFFSFFGGCFYRLPPFNEATLNEIAIAIDNQEKKKGNDYFLNPINFNRWNNIDTLSLGSGCEIRIVEKTNIEQDGFLFDVFSKEVDTEHGKFICSPLYSDGGLGSLHYSYAGSVAFTNLEGDIYQINYDVTRLVDVLIGPFYAIPYFGNLDIAELIEKEQGYSPSAAYIACENYMRENFSELELDNYIYNEICFVHEYNESLKTGKPEGDYSTPYNIDVFPTIDEKYNDKYLLFYCNNEEYDKVTRVILFVVDIDNGHILEIYNPKQVKKGKTTQGTVPCVELGNIKNTQNRPLCYFEK